MLPRCSLQCSPSTMGSVMLRILYLGVLILLICSSLPIEITLYISSYLLTECQRFVTEQPSLATQSHYSIAIYEDSLYQDGSKVAHFPLANSKPMDHELHPPPFFTLDIFMPCCYLIVSQMRIWVIWRDQCNAQAFKNFLSVSAKYRR